MTEDSAPHLQYEKYRLPNGLDVILSEDHRLPLVAVSLWYHVGAANERPGRTGFAHLFEHMMFEGSKHVGPEGHFRYLEAAGASEINGTTDFDRTNYFETLPSNRLELALWLESDRMGFLLERLDDAKLENQRDVVRNERRQSVESAPYGVVQEAVFHQLFPREHPYYASVIGSHADIEAARLDEVREFFRLYYSPGNASLAVVGDIDPSRTRDWVEKYFGPIPAGPPVPAAAVVTPPITAERRAVIGDQVELPRLYLAWLTPPIFQAGDAECDLIARILGGGKSSRLYRKLVYERRLAQDASAHQSSLAHGSVFTIEITAKPGVQPETLEAAVDEEIGSFLQDGPTQAELAGAQNIYESAIIRGLENLGGFGGVADRLNLYNHFLGDPGYLAADLERYREATAEAVRQTARRWLVRQARAVVYGVPGQKIVEDPPRSEPQQLVPASAPRETQDAASDWRDFPPAPGEASRPILPVPQLFRLGNGLSVYLVEQHSLPVVSANLVIMGGSDRNPAALPGLASFTAEILDEGTATRTALQIAEEADRLGTHLSTGSFADFSYVAFRSLRRNVASALELAADVLLRPAFPEREVERIRQDRLTEILRQRDNPQVLANKAFIRAIYGENHPYGYSELGTELSLRRMTAEDLRGFWRAAYLPGNAALVVAGDITAEELRDLAEKCLGSWSGNGPAHARPTAPEGNGRRVIIVDKPDLPQTALRVGHAGVERSHPDVTTLEVMNTALGGLFSSRINMNLREKNGFTYGASSVFSFRRGPGPFAVATAVRNDATAAAVAEILKEIEGMRGEQLSGEELETARDSISRSLPGQFETTPQTASSVGQIFIHDLSLHFYRDLPLLIDEVDAADILRVSREHLHPEQAVIVAVGDRRRIEDSLRALEIGPVALLQPQQVSSE